MKIYNNTTLKKNNLNCLCKKTSDNKKICLIDNESIFFKSTCNIGNFDLSTKFWTQLSLNGNISFQCNKPLIEEIDSINAKIQILNQKVLKAPLSMSQIDFEGLKGGERIIKVYGLVCLSVNYIGTLKNQQVFTFNDKIPFSATIDLPLNDSHGEDTLNFNYIISSCIEDVHINSIIDRYLNVTVTFILSATKSFNKNDFCMAENYLEDSNIQCTEIKNCSNCDEENQIVFKGIFSQDKIEEILNIGKTEKYRKRFASIEVLDIPVCNPNIVKILSVITNIKILCQKVIKTPTINRLNFENKRLTGVKLIVDFMLYQTIKYSSNTLCESIHSATFNIPASFYITVPETTLLTDKFKISYYIDDIYACILNERQIFKSVSILFHAKPINCKENIQPPDPVVPNNIITFKGKEEKIISTLEIDTNQKILIVTSSGEVTNSDFGNKDYFSFELVNQNGVSKIKETVNGNQNADNFKANLNNKFFEEGDAINLTYRERTRVLISNYEIETKISVSNDHEQNQYHPKYFSESYRIQENGLRPNNPNILPNVIIFKGKDDNEVSIVRFNKDNRSLIVGSSGLEANSDFPNQVYFSFEIKDAFNVSKIKSQVNGNQDADNFRNTLNGKSFDYGDILILTYKENNKVNISNYEGIFNYNPSGDEESYEITPQGLKPIKALDSNIITILGERGREFSKLSFDVANNTLLVTSTGNQLVPVFSGPNVFQLIFKSQNLRTKNSLYVKGTENADNFKNMFNNLAFQIGDILRFRYMFSISMFVSNYMGQKTYETQRFSESFQITPNGLKPVNFNLLKNTIILNRTNEPNEIAIIQFAKKGLKLFVNASGGKINNRNFRNREYFRFKLRQPNGVIRQNQFIAGNQNAIDFSTALDEQRFNIGDILRLKYREKDKVIITNFNGQMNYNPNFYSEQYRITINGLEWLDNRMLQNIITFKGENNSTIAILRFDITDKIFIVDSSGIKANEPLGDTDYFSITLKESDNTEKFKSVVKANEDGDNLSNIFDEKSFNFGDILTLTQRENTKVEITNLEGQAIYNPSNNEESYLITKDGLLLIKDFLQNVIIFKSDVIGDVGLPREMASVRFNKATMKLIVTSTSETSRTQFGEQVYFSFELLDSSGLSKIKASVKANEIATNFAGTLNETSFEINDSITLTYLKASRVEITDFNGQRIYNPSGNTESYIITSTGLTKKS